MLAGAGTAPEPIIGPLRRPTEALEGASHAVDLIHSNEQAGPDPGSPAYGLALIFPLTDREMPRMTQRSSHPALRTSAVLLLSALALTGCDNHNDELAQSLVKANARLEALTKLGAAPSEDALNQAYTEIASSVRSAIGTTKNKGEQAAANLVLAQAELGLASLAAKDTAQHAARVLALLSTASGVANTATELDQQSKQWAALDASAAFTTLNLQIDRLASEIEAHEAEINRVNTLIAGHQSKIDAAQTVANRHRDEEARKIDAAQLVEGPRYQELVTEAMAARRSAEAQELIISENESKVRNLQSELSILSIRRDEAAGELTNAKADRDGIAAAQQEWASSARSRGTELRAAAAEASAAIKAAAEYIEQTYTPTMQQAADGYNKAVSEARKAQSTLRSGVQATTGSANHALASLHRQDALIQETLTALASRVASIGGEPDAMRAIAQAAQERLDEARLAEGQARREAASALNGIGGDESAAAQALSERLEGRAADLLGESGQEPNGE